VSGARADHRENKGRRATKKQKREEENAKRSHKLECKRVIRFNKQRNELFAIYEAFN